jgi:hypothetical protein
MTALYAFEIGNDKDVRVFKRDGIVTIVIRDISTEQDLHPSWVSLNIQQWHELLRHAENASEALTDVIKGQMDVDFIHPFE